MSENKITFPVKLASNNPQSFGIVDATEISGHRSVDTLSDLYSISDPVLSVLKDGSDAIGQEWFVVSEDCKYRLDNWENRKSVSGWIKLPKQELINTKQSVSEKDQPSGYAGLDSNGKIPIEKTYGTTATVVNVATYEELPVAGLSGVIYYVSNTSAQYKWSGSAYVNITDGADNAKKNETSIFDCSNGTSTKYYSSLSAAINVVPPVYRTSNRIISYLSTENSPTSAVNYQYHGINSTTWTDLTKWKRIPNQADLEDIRSDLNNIGTSVISKLSVSDYCNESDFVKNAINLTPNGFYNYKTLEYIVNSNFSSIRIDNVNGGDIYQFSGDVAYSQLAAVIFIDQENNIIDYLYGDNTSSVIHFDTGLIIIPINCSSVIFQAYTINSNCYLYRYNVPKALTSDNVAKNIWEVVNPNNDMKSTRVIVESGFFYNGNTLIKSANAAFSCGVADVEAGDKVSYNGVVRYSALWAIIFADENNNIIQRIGNNATASETINTGIIAIPPYTKKVFFGAYGNSFDAYVYKQAAIINEVSINDYIPDVDVKTKYINAYHYLFGGTTQADIVNSGFDSSAFDSSTANSFLIHSKYFKSYRRKIEWRIQLTSSSVVLIGTGGSTSSILVASRQTQIQIDVPASLLKIYTSEGVIHSTVPLSTIYSDKTYIVRLEQNDYEQKFTVLNEKTLFIVASYSMTATPQNSITGKLLGYPFIKIVSGYVKVIAYDVFLMKNPYLVFVGDSITECGYRQNTYASMFIENELKGDGCIIAQGGANIDTLNFSWESEIPFMKPKFLSLLGGTNGTISQAQINYWSNKCAENGIIFILNRVPVSKDPATYPWEDKNSIIRNSKIMGANFDYATALNNNPVDGADNALFGDNVHPNAEGHAKMYIRFVNDVQII